MNTLNHSEEEPLLTFSDLVHIAKKNKRKIWCGALIFALLGFLFSLTRPIEYQSTATFKEKGKTHLGFGKSLSAFFLGNDTSDNEALTMMKSRKLTELFVKEAGLQASISKRKAYFPLPYWQEIKDNIAVEYGLFKKLRTPSLPDPIDELHIDKVTYNGEVPRVLRLNPISNESFAIFDENNHKVGEGSFGLPFATLDYSITLSRIHPLEKEYWISLSPLGITAESVKNQFRIETDPTDKGLIKISYKNRDRRLAASHIKTFMETYQNYTRMEQERINALQISYLHKRQKEMGSQLEEDMHDYAAMLSSDLSTTGFATSSKAMEFLASNQQHLKQKMLSLNLEIQRLQNLYQDNSIDCEKLVQLPQYESINVLIKDMHELKQQADSLNLALRTSSKPSESFQASFAKQLAELDELRECAKDAREMHASLEKNILSQPFPRLVNNPNFIVKEWYQQLAENRSHDPISWQKNKASFSAYLSNLIHYLGVYQRSLEERLSHQQSPSKEFQGINLQSAKDLYMSYSRELSDVESETIQQQFIIKQIDDPNFEISSLSKILNDPVSANIISKTTQLLLSYKDRENLSNKEQDRLKNDLALQKGFLTTHLHQNVILLDLRQNFLKEKIHNLQTINLSLIHEQISILENQIKNLITNTIADLKREEKLLQTNLSELHYDMSAMPKKWAAERMIGQEMAINRRMMEEITKLVESKIINDNTEKIQAAPVDLPLIPIHPKSPNILLFTLIGAITGTFLTFAWTLATTVSKGIEILPETLHQAGLHYSGTLSGTCDDESSKNPIRDKDLETLRRLASFILDKDSHDHNTVLLLENHGPSYAKSLAMLFSKKGLRVVLIDLSFNDPAHNHTTGLLSYLQGGPEPQIEKEKDFDLVPSGGICRYGNELLSSQKFSSILQSWQKQYDWVIAYSQISPQSAAAETLIAQFSNAVINLRGESYNSLRNSLKVARLKGTKLTFISTPPIHFT